MYEILKRALFCSPNRDDEFSVRDRLLLRCFVCAHVFLSTVPCASVCGVSLI